METKNSITVYFGGNLAVLLAEKITEVFSEFESDSYINAIAEKCPDQSYPQRIELHADQLRTYLPNGYEEALSILLKILAPENPK